MSAHCLRTKGYGCAFASAMGCVARFREYRQIPSEGSMHVGGGGRAASAKDTASGAAMGNLKPKGVALSRR